MTFIYHGVREMRIESGGNGKLWRFVCWCATPALTRDSFCNFSMFCHRPQGEKSESESCHNNYPERYDVSTVNHSSKLIFGWEVSGHCWMFVWLTRIINRLFFQWFLSQGLFHAFWLIPKPHQCWTKQFFCVFRRVLHELPVCYVKWFRFDFNPLLLLIFSNRTELQKFQNPSQDEKHFPLIFSH